MPTLPLAASLALPSLSPPPSLAPSAPADGSLLSQLNAALSFGAATWNLERERESDRDHVQQGKYLLCKINTQLSKM